MKYDFTPTGFPKIFSEMVSKALMELPPLTKENDGYFVSAIADKTIVAFWTEYIGALPYEVQSELLIAVEKEDTEKMLEWYALYANFLEDENARELASIILDELNEEFSEIIKEEYRDFHAVSPVTV